MNRNPVSLDMTPGGGRGRVRVLACLFVLLASVPTGMLGQENEDCFLCHSDITLQGERGGRTISLYVKETRFAASVHGDLECVSCHMDIAGEEMPHDTPLEPVECGLRHDAEQEEHVESLHGRALARGDPLAPGCDECHGSHYVIRAADPASPVYPLNIPLTCGRCHRAGAPVQRQRDIHQANIIDNYTESIHGEGLLRAGLIVSANCSSCHTAHFILPHTDNRSSIARGNIAATCARCHVQIEAVHQTVIRGELWEREAHVLPACVDCHPPHTIRRVFYSQGVADSECLECHTRPDIVATDDDRSLSVDAEELQGSDHAETTCSQCHSGVNASRRRPCSTLTEKVDCSSCHAEMGRDYSGSIHGVLLSQNDPNAPSCKECHGTHGVLGKAKPQSPTFPTNVPALCARCHREGEKAAVRYVGSQHDVVQHYVESIHGKGLMKSGLTVTAMCTSCHTAHSVLPKIDTTSSVYRSNIARTCGNCHHGIQEQFQASIHFAKALESDEDPPVCVDCHSAHTIRRADEAGFMLAIMSQCGRCHEEIARTYFETYHGKVSQLGYTKTAKCYDCHGAHDILPVSDPRSHLSRDNVVKTCQKCHPGANRRFAGYLTHATHHDPDKYPFLYYTFWGMAGLLMVTFVVSGIHTVLWLPRALKLRRERKKIMYAVEGRAATAPEEQLEQSEKEAGKAEADRGDGPEEGNDG
ncbi:MAG: hypothetical protein KAJ12_06985 [Bacteroidetes bacterium]|nr:hypothetical protein [Bacteroidota bacterium]